MLTDKEIVLGITGGIAAYKVPELTRMLLKQKARVTIVMTRNAERFVSPLSLQVLTNRAVITDLFEVERPGQISHVETADRAALLLIAPATANIIAKLAHGIADDALSTLALACRAPVLIAPAMNVNMWNHPATQANVKTLKERGIYFVGPAAGELACGWEGKGRLAELDDVVEEAALVLSPKDFAGKKVLVTAGPTREFIDPVRYISNRSSGKMGYAVARVGRRRGAEVCLISGPTALRPPPGVRVINVMSARQMYDVSLKEADKADIIIKASAVADYRPITEVSQKIKKGSDKLSLELTENPDILAQMGRRKKDQILVGFAAETSSLVQHADKKLHEKNLDLIVANDVTRPGAGFDSDTNIVLIIDKHGRKAEWPRMPKLEVADHLFDRILAMSKREEKIKKRSGKNKNKD
ncbi:MAG TPA: bifunctional phosphopantothenoylcysteine decarboxylase/phosphopantothenate--cysteine ligase CoaBC [bacterium]|nr:bifunctional phosphopantothenoylcysteine decarboxylase/phosphopantothenate--cysteine ligase CoaBC [bacterium]